MARGRSRDTEELKRLFRLHRGERNGFLLFILLLLAVVVVRAAYLQWFDTPAPVDVAALEAEWQAMQAERTAAEAPPVITGPTAPFDPNTLEQADWVALGLTERQAEGVMRYMAKGGRFRVKRDVAKLYAVTPELYARWEPFIELPDSLVRRTERRERPAPFRRDSLYRNDRPAATAQRASTWERRPVEVNTADTTMLIELPGIGPAFARGIVRYREKLGGYRSLEQLSEVYVLRDKPDAVARITPLLVVDTLMVRRIPINTCTVEDLAAHPYAGWKVAKALIAYRAQHGPFTAVEGIRGCALIDEDLFRKLAPYLRVE